jgi:ABC-type nitrate/sulfonate/bicarbonate transport system permease component
MGVLLDNLAAALDMPAAFATLLSLTVIGFVLYALMEAIERRVIFWQNDAAMRRVSARRRRAWGARA